MKLQERIILLLTFISFLGLNSCSSSKNTKDNLVKIIPGEQQIFWYEKPEDYLITPKIQEYLDLIISYVNEKDNDFKAKYVINLEGHSDDTGSKMENSMRSELRVKSIIEYLTDNGIPQNNIKFLTYSNTIPYSNPNTVEGKKLDRRVVIKFNL